MIDGDGSRDLAALVVPLAGSVTATGDVFRPFRLLDADGSPVGAVDVFLAEVQAAGRSVATQRSYALDVLRWLRFCWAIEVPWDQATSCEARDFIRWMMSAAKPARPHWRTGQAAGRTGAAAPGSTNPVTGKKTPGRGYAASTVAHCESVLRAFYGLRLEAGAGIMNPFPLARRPGRAAAHRSPMDPVPDERAGRYRPRVTERVPRQIPDTAFAELFAALGCHRDRALAAFWISTGARAAELLSAWCGGVCPGDQTITVVRKGTRALQALPASPDAFVWLRLYQEQMHGLVPAGGDDPVWWTRRRPFRRLGYHAARAMFVRANASLGANWSLHDLRHSAAYRMARDPLMPITDVQWVLGHAHLTTTQIYTRPAGKDVIAGVLAHHRRRADQAGQAPPPPAAYRPESLDELFGKGAW
jgi:site-specific recombinase XerC